MSMDEIRARTEVLRQKAIAGTLTLEECKEAVRMVREHRGKVVARPASVRAPKAGGAPASDIPSADDLLKGLL